MLDIWIYLVGCWIFWHSYISLWVLFWSVIILPWNSLIPWCVAIKIRQYQASACFTANASPPLRYDLLDTQFPMNHEVFILLHRNQHYSWSCMSTGHCFHCSLWIVLPQLLIVSSHACTDQYSSEYLRGAFYGFSEFCVQLSLLWYSFLSTLATLVSPRLSTSSFQLREHIRFHLGSLLCLFQWIKLGDYRTHYICYSSIRIIILHCLLSGILKIIVLYIFKRYFGCFKWEGKSIPCYSTLLINRRQLPFLMMMNMSFQKSISEPLINYSKENKFSHLFRAATLCEVFFFLFN